MRCPLGGARWQRSAATSPWCWCRIRWTCWTGEHRLNMCSTHVACKDDNSSGHVWQHSVHLGCNEKAACSLQGVSASHHPMQSSPRQLQAQLPAGLGSTTHCVAYRAAVSSEEAEEMARRLGLKFYRSCVKEGLNVTEGELQGVFLDAGKAVAWCCGGSGRR